MSTGNPMCKSSTWENYHVNAIDKMKIFFFSILCNVNKERKRKRITNKFSLCLQKQYENGKISFNACIRKINHKSDHRNVMFCVYFFFVYLKVMECG